MVSPKLSANCSMLLSMVNPKWPAMIPMKNTKATPKEMPLKWSLPSASPKEQMAESTTMACTAECILINPSNHMMFLCVFIRLPLVVSIGLFFSDAKVQQIHQRCKFFERFSIAVLISF